jgi:hypothetical protein
MTKVQKNSICSQTTASMEKTSVQASKDKEKMEEDSAEAEKSTGTKENEWQDEEMEEAYLTAKNE